MTARRGSTIASTAAMAVAVALASAGRAELTDTFKQARERPRGVVEDCSRIRGVTASREFTLERNLVVGPVAILRAGRTLGYVDTGDGIGDKLFVLVRGGHRVTLELSRRTRRDVGLAGFGSYPSGGLRHRYTRRVVTFIACRRGEWPPGSIPDGWPVTGWVGFLLARSPRCVPLLVWVDEETRPRRAVIRFGVRSCG